MSALFIHLSPNLLGNSSCGLKNLYVFAFTKKFEWQEQDLEKQLSENLFTPCGSTEMAHFGWVNALGKHGSSTVHCANKNFLLCARKEEKNPSCARYQRYD